MKNMSEFKVSEGVDCGGISPPSVGYIYVHGWENAQPGRLALINAPLRNRGRATLRCVCFGCGSSHRALVMAILVL